MKRPERLIRCKNCNIEWIATRKDQLYCSTRCRREHWQKEHIQTFISPDGKMKTVIITK